MGKLALRQLYSIYLLSLPQLCLYIRVFVQGWALELDCGAACLGLDLVC
jgi:hypothetical protein